MAALCHALQPVRDYLGRVGFMMAVEKVARFTPFLPRTAYAPSVGESEMLIEVTKIQAASELPAILRKVISILCTQLRYRDGHARDVAIAISEIAYNMFDHNAQTCGFLAMQVYRGTERRFLEIGVCDYGAGLAATLRRNPKSPLLPSDLHAIAHATQFGTSEYDDPTRGTGLHHLLTLASAHEGMVQIRSGAGTIRYRMDKKQERAFSVYPLPGVHIALELGAKGVEHRGLTGFHTDDIV